VQEVGIEDPHVALEAYLRDPRGEAERLRTQVIDKLLVSARKAVLERDRPRALGYLDRVLALEDGRAEALALLGDLDRASRRKLAVRGGAALAAVALLAGVWLWFAPRSESVFASGGPQRSPLVTQLEQPTVTSEHAPKPAAREPTRNQATQSIAPPKPQRTPQERPERKAVRPPTRPRETGPRTVVFNPEPANVTISVDGAPPRSFGPSFHNIELQPGQHTFRFVGAHECCEERVVSVDIPPGPGQTVLDPKLPFRPARVYVACDVPADVVLDDNLASGRTRSFIQVPVEEHLIEKRRISVTAPGYEPYTGTVELRAGQVAQVPVVLKPSAPH
jgi:hypothetical protein